jgi:hypothetical protein
MQGALPSKQTKIQPLVTTAGTAISTHLQLLPPPGEMAAGDSAWSSLDTLVLLEAILCERGGPSEHKKTMFASTLQALPWLPRSLV